MAVYLGVKQSKAIDLCLSGLAPPQIAQELGVSLRTVYRWFQSPDVQQELERRRQEIAEAARRILAGAATKAARTLVELLDCNKPRVRLDAAIALIDRLRVLESTNEQAAAIQELVATLKKLRDEYATDETEPQTVVLDTPGDAPD